MITGKVFKYGDNVDTDVIIPARYLNAPEGGLAGRAAVFGASLLLYLAALLFSWKKAEKSFEKIDL